MCGTSRLSVCNTAGVSGVRHLQCCSTWLYCDVTADVLLQGGPRQTGSADSPNRAVHCRTLTLGPQTQSKLHLNALPKLRSLALQHMRPPITCMQHPALVPTGHRCDAVPALECQSTRGALPNLSARLLTTACAAFFAQGHQSQHSAGWRRGVRFPAAGAGALPAAHAARLTFLHRFRSARLRSER